MNDFSLLYDAIAKVSRALIVDNLKATSQDTARYLGTHGVLAEGKKTLTLVRWNMEGINEDELLTQHTLDQWSSNDN